MSKSSTELNDQLRPLLAELWADCFRRGVSLAEQRRMMDVRLRELADAAITGRVRHIRPS